MYKKKIFIVLSAIVCSLILIEFILRLAGFGYKVIHRPSRKPISFYRILCMGESTTIGVGAHNPARENYPMQLEIMLDKRFPYKRIDCLVDVKIGQNTSEILSKLPASIRRYVPHIVILMVGANNWWNLDRSNILLFNADSRVSSIALGSLIFLDKFRLWKLIKWLKFSLGTYKERWNYNVRPNSLDYIRNELTRKYGHNIYNIFRALTEHDITEMVRICKENKVDVIVCSYPMAPFLERMDVIQRKIAYEQGVYFVDNYLTFKKTPDLDNYLSDDNWHPNERGYELVAKNIYNCIVNNELIK